MKVLYIIKKMILLMSAVCFFGIFYPEFCLLPDTYRVIYEDGEGTEYEMESKELYYELLAASPEEITVKFKLWESIKQLWEKE